MALSDVNRYPVDLTSPPVSMDPGAITLGSTWNLHFLFRQEAGEEPNLTGALRVTFWN